MIHSFSVPLEPGLDLSLGLYNRSLRNGAGLVPRLTIRRTCMIPSLSLFCFHPETKPGYLATRRCNKQNQVDQISRWRPQHERTHSRSGGQNNYWRADHRGLNGLHWPQLSQQNCPAEIQSHEENQLSVVYGMEVLWLSHSIVVPTSLR